VIGPVADYVAAAAVIAVGIWMLAGRDDERAAGRAASARGLAVVALGALVGERLRERAEQVAGVALILLGCYLITERAIA